MFSDEVQIALIVAAFPTIGICIQAYFSYKADRKADGKLDEIHDLTNATATKANEQIGLLQKEVNRLNKVISRNG